MSTQGFSYNASRDNSTSRIVAITSVNPGARTAVGLTRERSSLDINCSYPVGGNIVTPAVGEQWYVYRVGLQYALQSKLPGNSPELLTEAVEGQVQVGTHTGPLTLHGSEVQVESNLKLGKTLYRDTNGTLESSTDDGTTWTAIKGGGASNLVTSVAGKLGDVTLDIPDINELAPSLLLKADLVNGKVPDTQITHRVFQYSSRATFPTEGASNTFYLDTAQKDIYAWIGGAYVVITSSLDAICNNPFFQNLQTFGTGTSPLSQVITGFQNLINQLWNALFCGFTGDLTPTTVINQIAALLAPLINNPFLEGLKNFATAMGKTITNLADGAITGATELFRVIFDFLFCRLSNDDLTKITGVIAGATSGIFNPAAILKLLTDFLGPLQTNPFLTGLRDFATAMGKTFTNLADGALNGAIELVRILTNLLTCGVSTTDLTKITTFITEKFSAGVFNPAALLSQLKGLIDTITNNAWVQMVKNLASTLGLGGANLIEQLLNGFGGTANWILKALKTYLPFIPWEQIFWFLPWGTINDTTLPIINGFNFQTLLNAFNPRNILLAVGDFVTNLTNFFGFDVTALANGSLSILDMGILFFNNVKKALLAWITEFVLGGFDNILLWAQANVTGPIVGNFLKGLNIDPLKFGIKTPADLATVGLGVLGDVAGTLLTKFSGVPASLVEGVLPPSVIGSVPVSNISDTSPNLITLGTFAESVNIDPSEGWAWDASQNAPQSSGGSAKLTISSAKNRYLYSRQTVPVGIGDRLVINASIKTNAVAVSPAGSTPISIAIIPFVGADEQETILIGTTAQNYSNWTTIGNTSTTPYTVSNPAWTSVVVRLGVDARATSGVVWWDDISLKKIGGLVQGNVDKLNTAWSQMIGGLKNTGQNTTGLDWTSLYDAAFTARNEADKGVSYGTGINQTLFGFPQGGSVFSSPGSLISSLAGVKADGIYTMSNLMYFLASQLSKNPSAGAGVADVYNAASGAGTTLTVTVPESAGRINQTNTNLFSDPAGGTVFTNLSTLISSLATVKIDGISTASVLLGYLVAGLSSNTLSGNTVSQVNQATTVVSTSTGRINDTNTKLFGAPQGGNNGKVLGTALPTGLAMVGSGSILSKTNGTAISAKLTGKNKFFPTFFNSVVTSSDMTAWYGTTQYDTGLGSTVAITGYDGRIFVTNTGWYICEVGFSVNPLWNSGGFNIAPILFKDGVHIKTGSDVTRTATRTGRYAQASWIVYLTAGQSVEGGYDSAIDSSGSNFFKDNGNGDTYFSVALLNKLT